MQDIRALERVVVTPTVGMPRMREAAHLLNLPANVEESPAGVSLKEACTEISGSEAQAEAFLSKMEYRHISRQDARSVLRRRVETFDWGVL
jgi:hypothetical protein